MLQSSKRFRYIFANILVTVLLLTACSQERKGEESVSLSGIPKQETDSKREEVLPSESGQIYLYGEQHGVKTILEKEFELWYNYYSKETMRHLFVELPYYTAEFLNLWMQSDSDEILETVYQEWEGTALYHPDVKAFYQKIKQECPQTIFHGTDVGHQYATTGKRFLEQLEQNGEKTSEQYQLAQKNIEQGKHYYKNLDDVYRENTMVENFIYQFDLLDGETIMGIYGSAHTGLNSKDTTGTIGCMANQLKEIYKDMIDSEDLTQLAKVTVPQRVDTIELNGKEYEASYFGKQDLTGFKDFVSREFWRLEEAYNDFKTQTKTGDVLPYDNYPMQIEPGEVFVIDYLKTDGTVLRNYYRSDGYVWEGKPATEGFLPE